MLTMTIYEASGEVFTYVQEDTELAAQSLDRLHPAKVFEEGRVLVGSPLGLSIYNGHRISRIDLQADKTLASLLPPDHSGPSGVIITPKEWKGEFANPDAPADAGIEKADLYTCGVQFGLLGNHSVFGRVTGELAAPMERFSRISRLLSLPSIRLMLPPHGVTLLNPGAITRITLQPAFSTLPQDTWLGARIG